MEYVALGKTGLTVSVMGLGCGGHSRIGMPKDPTGATSQQVVRAALDAGVTLLDTAEAYGTEEQVGRALAGVPRDRVVISSKIGYWKKGEGMLQEADVMRHLEASLSALRTDYLDIYHVHGVQPNMYGWVKETLYPQLATAKEQGKIRYIGITEGFGPDTGHAMLQEAVQEDLWDVMMVGFNLLNPSARERVLAATRRKGIGTLCMYAVRRALRSPDAFNEAVGKMIVDGAVDPDAVDRGDPAADLFGGNTASLSETAYRFCRHEPGIDCVLSGSGSPEHVAANAAALGLPPLPDALLARLEKVFGGVDSVSGN